MMRLTASPRFPPTAVARQRADPIRRHVRQRIYVAALVGALVGSVIVALPVVLTYANGSGGGLFGPPSFALFLNYTGSSESNGTYTYSFELVGIEPGEVFTQDTQFYVPTFVGEVNRSPSVPAIVRVVNASGLLLATFNTTRSTFRGPGSGLQTPLAMYGGWVTGNDTQILVGDSVEVVSTFALTNCEFWVATDANGSTQLAFETQLTF